MLRRSNVLGCALLLLAFAVIEPDRCYGEEQEAPEYQNAVIIEIEGEITPMLGAYVERRVAKAKNINADLIVFEIDTPGGYMDTALNISKVISEIDWAHTVALIPDNAYSAGALISLSCNEIRMSNDAIIGDVGIIFLDQQAGAFRYAPAKLVSALVEEMRRLAKRNGHPEELAEAMVDKDKVLFVKNLGNAEKIEYRLVQGNPEEKSFESPGDEWELISEASIDRFLTVNGERSLALALADGLTEDRDELRKQLNVSSWTVYTYRTADTVVYYLNSPFITGLLIAVALVAFYIEFSAPGLGAGGLIGTLCIAVFFWSRFLGGTAEWLEVILFLAGVSFLLCEIFVIPGWGISGLMGLFLMVASLFMAQHDFYWPSTEEQIREVTTSAMTLVVVFCVVLIGAGLVSRRLGSIPVFSRLMLAPPSPDVSLDGQSIEDKTSAKPGAAVHPDVSIGDWGTAESLLRPSGRARFGTKSFDVTSETEFIESGNQVRVVRINGNRIIVEKVKDA